MAKKAPIVDTPDPRDLGFGSGFKKGNKRLINKDGSFNVIKSGGGLGAIHGYHIMLTTPWWKFLGYIGIGYVLINLFFASIYMLVGVETLTGVAVRDTFWGKYANAFYFSVQTFTTVGYGTLSPKGDIASLVASFEAMIGLMGFALATGLLYGRFSQPTAKIAYSSCALIAPYQDINSFQLRVINRRQNQLIELEARIALRYFEEEQGTIKQQFFVLNLERDKIAMFPLSWTVVHPIDKDSPLYGVTPERMEEMDAEFIVMMKGYDETFAQHVYSRSSYKPHEIKWGSKFTRIFHPDEDGNLIMDIDRIDETYEVELN
ncbi:MAG: ion channel [Bacteroidota bacterium]